MTIIPHKECTSSYAICSYLFITNEQDGVYRSVQFVAESSIVTRMGHLIGTSLVTWLALPAAFALGLGLIAVAWAYLPRDHEKWEGTVIDIADDGTLTVEMHDGARVAVRLSGIDTLCDIALEALRTEFAPPGVLVHLTVGDERLGTDNPVFAYVHRAKDGVHINNELVKQGYAKMAGCPNDPQQQALAQSELQAQAMRIGMWR